MKRIPRRLKVTLIVSGLLLVGSIAGWRIFFRTQIVGPREEFERLITYAETAPPDGEIRRICHACIRWYPHHDSLLLLEQVGDETSLKLLIRNLERLQDTQMCTKDHCIDALASITGQQFGDDVEEWRQWHRNQ